MSRISSGQLALERAPTDIVELVRRTASSFAETTGRDIRFDVRDGGPEVHANIVAECDTEEDRLNRMKAVQQLSQHAQREIDLRLRESPPRTQAHAAASVEGCRSRSLTPSRVK